MKGKIIGKLLIDKETVTELVKNHLQSLGINASELEAQHAGDWDGQEFSGYAVTITEKDLNLKKGSEVSTRQCARCGSDLGTVGFCLDETCPFSDKTQDNPRGWIGHPDTPVPQTQNT